MKRKIPFNLIGFVLGLAMLAAGAYFIYPPAALVTPGIILMVISIFGDREKK